MYFVCAAGESELIELEEDVAKQSPFPLVQCSNIYILPGVPELLQQKWRTLKVSTLFLGFQKHSQYLPNLHTLSAF